MGVFWDGSVDKARTERKVWIEGSLSPVGTHPGASYLHLNACGCTMISKWLPVPRECKRSSVLILRPDFY